MKFKEYIFPNKKFVSSLVELQMQYETNLFVQWKILKQNIFKAAVFKVTTRGSSIIYIIRENCNLS